MKFAQIRRGYENQDCHEGIDYSEHLDETPLPSGYVAVYNGNGELDGVPSHAILETEYLQLLRQHLLLNDRQDLAAQLEQFIRKETD